jgi:hypothetical protein
MAETKKAAPEHEDHPPVPAADAPDGGGGVDKIVFVAVVAIAAGVFALVPARTAADHGSDAKGERAPAAPVRALEPPPSELSEDDEGEAEFEIVEEEVELPEGDPWLEPDDGEPAELELVPPSAPAEPVAPQPKTADPIAAPPAPAPAAQPAKPKPKPAAPKPPSGDNPY